MTNSTIQQVKEIREKEEQAFYLGISIMLISVMIVVSLFLLNKAGKVGGMENNA